MSVRVECSECFAKDRREEKSIGSIVAQPCATCGAMCGPGTGIEMHRPSTPPSDLQSAHRAGEPLKLTGPERDSPSFATSGFDYYKKK